MKITLELPDELVKRLKVRAVRDGRKLKDTAADVLKAGLAVSARAPRKEDRAVIGTDERTGLPVILCRRTPEPQEVSPERLDEILLEQEVNWFHDSSG
jgi:plasmid stability protein